MNSIDISKLYLVTGGAGFIGYHLSKRLLEQGAKVIALDNMNDYYEVSLKEERLRLLCEYKNFSFIKCDIANKTEISTIFEKEKPEIVVNLAAQAGEIGRAHV